MSASVKTRKRMQKIKSSNLCQEIVMPSAVNKDIWRVDIEYPYKVHDLRQDIYDVSAEQIYPNSIYAAYAKNTPTTRGVGFAMNYYRHSIEIKKLKFEYEETALVKQKELLIQHYEHKISKIPKKKKEVEMLNNIITTLDNEIQNILEEHPDKFI